MPYDPHQVLLLGKKKIKYKKRETQHITNKNLNEGKKHDPTKINTS